MIVISYDIENDKLRTRFGKYLTKNGAIRLQFSVYEINNTSRLISNIKLMIEKEFRPLFGGGDSIIIFEVKKDELIKYGNAIHRDQDMIFI